MALAFPNTPVPGEIKWCPGVGNFVQKVITRHMVTGIKTVEIKLHLTKFFRAIGCQWFFLFICFTLADFVLQ